ncbi:hypothetical protein [Parvularcula bermudensis]|nr:hypothetical protein [Parvularcula bermudensis]
MTGRTKKLFGGAGISLVALTAAMALSDRSDATMTTAPTLDRGEVIVVDPQATASVMTPAAIDELSAPALTDRPALLPSDRHMRWALGAAFGALLGTAFAAFGAHRLLRWITEGRQTVGQLTQTAARHSRAIAKSASQTLGRSLKTPARRLAKGSGYLTLAAVTLLLLDLSWKASLTVGIGTLGVAAIDRWSLQHRKRVHGKETGAT